MSCLLTVMRSSYWFPWSLSSQYLHQLLVWIRRPLNPLKPGAFCKKPVFWTFWRFSGWILTKLALIWSNMRLWHHSLPFSPIASRFMTFWLGHALKASFSIFEFFFAFLFSLFLFFSLQWLTFYWACLWLKNFYEGVIETGKFYDGTARCSGRKFCSGFFTQLFDHFCAYLGLHWANHLDLGIIGKMFSSCTSWVWVMPNLVKRNDVRSGRRAEVQHGRLRPTRELMG